MRKGCWSVLLVLTLALTGCSASKPLAALTVPYGDHEGFVYGYSVNSRQLTEARIVVKKDQYERRAAWLIAMELQLDDQGEVNEVWADPASLQPLYSRIRLRSPQGDYDIRSTYSEKQINLRADTPQGTQQVERNISGAIYDNAQILMTLRALPLATGYQTKLSFVQTKNVTRGEMTIRVLNQEKVQVPAGEFDCYRVEMNIQGVKQSCWYSTDAQHWLIKYDNGQSQFALIKAEHQS